MKQTHIAFNRPTTPLVTASDAASLQNRRYDVANLVVLVITFAALALRLWHLEFLSLWWDEGVSIYLAKAGIPAMTVAKDFTVDLHPPAYHLALGGWLSLLGASVFSDRLFSTFAGVLTIPLCYQLVRRVCDRLAGIIAAVLAAASPIAIYYSQETRMYAFLPLLALLSLYVSTRVLQKPETRWWIFWVLANTLGLYAYYYLGMLSMAESVVLFVFALQNQRFKSWLVAQIALSATYVPWLAIMLRRVDQSLLSLPISTEVHLTRSQFVWENLQSFTVGFSLPPDGQYLMGLFLALGLLGAASLARRQPLLFSLLVLSITIPFVGAGLVLSFRPFFFPRFILFVVVPIWTLVAIGLTAERRVWPIAAIVLGLILAGNGWTWYHERTSPRSGGTLDDYRAVFTNLAAKAQPGDVVICGYPWQVGYVEAYLSNKHLRPVFLPGHLRLGQIASLLAPSDRVWVYSYSPDHRFDGDWPEIVLQPTYATHFVDEFGDSRIRLFSPPATATPRPSSPIATLGNTLELDSAEIGSTQVSPGDRLSLALFWSARARPEANYTVFVHVVGPDGKIWTQQDAQPVHGAFPTKQWSAGETVVDRYLISLSANTPAGAYRIEVGMYQPSTGQRLKVGPDPNPNDVIELATLTVK